MADDAGQLALRLLEERRTLVIATPDAWAAPVYYVHAAGQLCFFSSERSRHVAAALESGRCAGAVFRDGDDWRSIEGLQMEGRLEQVEGDAGADVFARYLAKFPTAAELFGSELDAFMSRSRASLWAFVPARVFYVNNGAGLGRRVEIRLCGEGG